MAICPTCKSQFNPDYGQCMACAVDPAVQHDRDEEQANREDALVAPEVTVSREIAQKITNQMEPLLVRILYLQRQVRALEAQVAEHKRQELLIQKIGQTIT
jgi:hypothetical protein